MLDHACKLGPQGHITFSCGTKAAACCLSPLSSCSVLSSLQAAVVFSSGHTWTGDLSLTESSITSPLAWMSWHRTEAQTVGYQIKTQGSFFHSSLFISRHLLLFFNHCSARFCLSVLLCFFLALCSTPLSPRLSLSLWRRGDPGVSSQKPARWVVQTTGKMFHFFFFFSLLLHLSKSPLHLSIRV